MKGSASLAAALGKIPSSADEAASNESHPAIAPKSANTDGGALGKTPSSADEAAESHPASADECRRGTLGNESHPAIAPKSAHAHPGGSLKKGSASSKSMQRVIAKNRVARLIGKDPSHSDEATSSEPHLPVKKASTAPAGLLQRGTGSHKTMQRAIAKNRVAALMVKTGADEVSSKEGRRGAIRRGSTMNVEIATKLETGELSTLAIGEPPKKELGCFRASMIRRQVYAGMKTSMHDEQPAVQRHQDPESRPNKPVKEVRKLKDIAAGMVQSTRVVLAKEKVTGAFVRDMEEKKMRDLLMKRTSEFMKCSDWNVLQHDLDDLRESTYALERKYNGMINLLDVRLDIDKMLNAVEGNSVSTLKCASVRELFKHMADIPISSAEEAEDLWASIVEAEQVLAQTKECNSFLWQHAANNATHIDSGSAGKACELPENIAALLDAMPAEAFEELKGIIVSQSNGHSKAEMIGECTAILTGLGATPEEIQPVIDEIQKRAWEDMAHSGMEMFELETGQGDAAEEIAIMKQKLAEKYPHLCKIESPRRRDGGRLAVLQALGLETPEVAPTPGTPRTNSNEMPGQAVPKLRDDKWRPRDKPELMPASDNPELRDDKWPEDHMSAHAAAALAASDTPEACDTPEPGEVKWPSMEQGHIETRSSSKDSLFDLAHRVSIMTRLTFEDIAENLEPALATSDPPDSEPGSEPDNSKPLEEPQGAIEQEIGLATPIPTPEAPRANSEEMLEQAAPALASSDPAELGNAKPAEESREAIEQEVGDPFDALVALDQPHEEAPQGVESPKGPGSPVAIAMSYSERFTQIHSERIAPVLKPKCLLKKPRGNRRFAISTELEEFELSHLSSFASARESHSLTHIALSLASLRQHLLRVWVGIEEAAIDIADRSMLDQPDMLAMSTFVDALKESGYPCDSGEICALFRFLGVNLTDEGTLSKIEFMRVAELEQRCGYDEMRSHDVRIASDSLRVHQTHRVLVQSLSNSERILAEMRIAKAREINEVEEDSLLRKWPSLAETLEKCLEELAGAEAEAFAKALLSKCGLLVLVEIMVATNIQSDLRALSVSVVSLAVEISGGADFQARPVAEAEAMAASSANWLSNSRVYSEAVVACKGRLFHETVKFEKHMSSVPFPTLPTAPRFRIPTPPTTVDDRKATKLELALASYLWRPILEHIDPEEANPEPLTPHIFAQILALMRQTHLDFVIVGACGARLMLHIGSALRRLQGHGRRQMDTQKVVAAIDELCGCVSPTVVHQIAAALGGRRLLRDRLQMLGSNADATLLQCCERLYGSWCYERRRLAARWLHPVAKWKDDAKINAIMKTAEITRAEGLLPMFEASLPISRPSLLTAPAPPRTAALHPSPRLQLQVLHSGNEDGLISWLDNQSDSSGYVPHGNHHFNRQRSRKGAHDAKPLIFKLPKVSAKQMGTRIGWDPWKFDE